MTAVSGSDSSTETGLSTTSRPDGRWCGLLGEVAFLRDLGCYADFTMPSLPSATQSRLVNQIYWCSTDGKTSKCFDHGIEAAVGGGVQGDLLMITGPLGIRFRERLVPRLETGELARLDPPTPYRVRRWFDLAPRMGEDIFLKLYTHGAQPNNRSMLLNSGLRDLLRWCTAEAARRPDGAPLGDGLGDVLSHRRSGAPPGRGLHG